MSLKYVKKFFEIIHKGRVSDLESFLSNGEKDIPPHKFILKSSNDSPLHIAIRTEKYQLVEWLLNNGFDVFLEHQNNDGKRPLHEASQINNLDILNILIKKGATIDPLKRADWTPLMLATAKGYLPIIKILIEAKSSLNLFNKDGWTPFHIACRNADVEVVKFILSKNPELWKTKSKNGRTPLHTAALHGNENIVNLLLEKAGYDINDSDSCGNTPLMDAVRSGHLPCVISLLDRNPESLNVMDRMGRLPIHLAAEAGQTSVVKLLISKFCVDVNSLSRMGEIPLHFAVEENQLETAEFMISIGAFVNHNDYKGRTALWKAASSQKLESYNLLLNSGAEDAADLEGKTPSSLIIKKDPPNAK